MWPWVVDWSDRKLRSADISEAGHEITSPSRWVHPTGRAADSEFEDPELLCPNRPELAQPQAVRSGPKWMNPWHKGGPSLPPRQVACFDSQSHRRGSLGGSAVLLGASGRTDSGQFGRRSGRRVRDATCGRAEGLGVGAQGRSLHQAPDPHGHRRRGFMAWSGPHRSMTLRRRPCGRPSQGDNSAPCAHPGPCDISATPAPRAGGPSRPAITHCPPNSVRLNRTTRLPLTHRWRVRVGATKRDLGQIFSLSHTHMLLSSPCSSLGR